MVTPGRRAGSSARPWRACWGCASPAASSSPRPTRRGLRSEEHTSELQSRRDLVCRLLLEKKKQHASGGLENGGELFGGREAEVVVNLLPVPDRLRRLLEACQLVPTPELLAIEPMDTLHLD